MSFDASALPVGSLPDGSDLRFHHREDTSDANSIIACAMQDEYGIRDYDVRGCVVFDIGSHVGGVALLAAKLGAARVIAVEPVPENAAIIRANAALNGFDNGTLTVVEAACGAPGGMTMSYGWHVTDEGRDMEKDEPTATVHRFIGNTGIGAEPGYAPSAIIDVPTLTLADLIAAYGTPYIIKLDCEGGEWPLLAEPVIRTVEHITGEYHPWVGDALLDRSTYFTDNREEVLRRIGGSHDVSFHGPDGTDAGYFVATLREHYRQAPPLP